MIYGHTQWDRYADIRYKLEQAEVKLRDVLREIETLKGAINNEMNYTAPLETFIDDVKMRIAHQTGVVVQLPQQAPTKQWDRIHVNFNGRNYDLGPASEMVNVSMKLAAAGIKVAFHPNEETVS